MMEQRRMGPPRLALNARLRAMASSVQGSFLRMWRAGWQWLQVHTFLPTWLPARWRYPITGFVIATALMLLAAIGTWGLLQEFPNFAFVGSLPLLIVMFLAFTFGAGPSLFATIVGSAFLFFFPLMPYLTWDLSELVSVIGVAAHLIMVVSVSIFA